MFIPHVVKDVQLTFVYLSTDISGDLSLTLDPNPAPRTPADCEEDSLEAAADSPLVIPTMPAINPALRELTNTSRTQGQTTEQGKPGWCGRVLFVSLLNV